MKTPEHETPPRHDEAEEVGRTLAEAFAVRMERFPPSARHALLLACREHLLQQHGQIAKVLFEGK